MVSTIKGFFGDVRKLWHVHYLFNFLLAGAFYFLRAVPPFCNVLFSDSKCELDWREWEITIFVSVVIVFKTRKSGATTMLAYLSSMFMYLKIGNCILFMQTDPRMGLVYIILCVLVLFLFPEPSYAGPEIVQYFKGPNLQEELNSDKRVVWLVAFYAAWSPACVNFAPIFAELSAEYALENLKFGKLDVTRYPEAAKQYYINDSPFSKQLPTIALFKGGKEVLRHPYVNEKGQLEKFFFTVDNIKAAFDLNNLYLECKTNPLKKGKTQLGQGAAHPPQEANSHMKSE